MTKREKIYLVIFAIVAIAALTFWKLPIAKEDLPEIPHQGELDQPPTQLVVSDLADQYGQPLKDGEYKKLSIDLNGDGTAEAVTLTSPAHFEINGQATTVPYYYDFAGAPTSPESPDGYFGIADINTNDKQKELAFHDGGPSSDNITSFYTWDGRQIVKIGVLPGNQESMKFPGNSIVTTHTRGSILDTWFFDDDYKLVNNSFMHLPKELYSRNSTNTVYVNLPLVRSPKDQAIVYTTTKNEVVTIVGCDNIAWCQINTSKGITGWFKMSQFNYIDSIGMHATDGVFSDLSNAD